MKLKRNLFVSKLLRIHIARRK